MIAFLLTLKLPETRIAVFANIVDFDEGAHNEPPHLYLHCLASSLWFVNILYPGLNSFFFFFFWKFADLNFVVCFYVIKLFQELTCLKKHGSVHSFQFLYHKLGNQHIFQSVSVSL